MALNLNRLTGRIQDNPHTLLFRRKNILGEKMRLYERDYSITTEKEQSEARAINDANTCYLGNIKVSNSGIYRQLPKGVRHFKSVFPNNFLDIIDLDQITDLHAKNKSFKNLLENEKSIESDVQRYIRSTQSYHIVGSILKEYHFGHHAAYLFPEFQLGNSYQVDYMLVGDSSGGHEFLLVEFENLYGRITISDGEFGEVIRKGIKQIDDWKIWIEANFTSLVETFQKETNKDLPKEFYKLDISRFHYAVVAGRRTNHTDKTYNLKRRLLKDQNITLLHYDNLYDSAEKIIGEATY